MVGMGQVGHARCVYGKQSAIQASACQAISMGCLCLNAEPNVCICHVLMLWMDTIVESVYHRRNDHTRVCEAFIREESHDDFSPVRRLG